MKRQTKFLLIFTLIFAFSTVSAEAKGKKYGLFIGINDYPEQIGALFGCENDAKQMQKILTTKYGFNPADTTLLLSKAATREAIVGKIKMYAAKAKAGDIFVVHFSGHGSLFPDAYSNELDETKEIFFDDPETPEIDYPKNKYDTTIVPVDAFEGTTTRPWRNMILDDELYGMFSEFTAKGVKVVFISDSCHSGDIARNKKSNEKMRYTTMLRGYGLTSFDDLALEKPDNQRNITGRSMNNLYIVLTGASSDEVASDGTPKKMRMGLFTEFLVKALNAPGANSLTYSQLMTKVSANVKAFADKNDRDQTPQLEKRFGDVNAKIFSFPK